MKRKLYSTYFVLISLSFGILSFHPPVKKSFEKFLKKSTYTYIPSGNAWIDGQEKSVSGFYMSKGEVSNFQYLEFLTFLKSNNQIDKLKICQIDSLNWNNQSNTNSKMTEFYHTHPAYRNYPVVNISHEAAELYCEYISQALSTKYPGVEVVCRLPTYDEYVRASRGDDPKIAYGWNSNETRNSQGQILGNFARIGEECISKNSETGKFEVNLKGIPPFAYTHNDLLAPSESFWKNQFGLYNLSGNAAEMIDEPGIACGGSWSDPGFDVRIDSKKAYKNTDKTVGFRVVFSYLKDSK